MRIERSGDHLLVLRPGIPGAVSLTELACKCGFRVCQMCDELSCSQQYLRRVFLRDAGVAPKRWLLEVRMVLARKELDLGKDWRVVAEVLGFASVGSLRREFRTRMPVI